MSSLFHPDAICCSDPSTCQLLAFSRARAYHVTARSQKITMVVKVAISGAAGRMGRRLMSLAEADAEVELVQAIEYAAHPLMGKVLIALCICLPKLFGLIFLLSPTVRRK
jgi:hypothetical protein